VKLGIAAYQGATEALLDPGGCLLFFAQSTVVIVILMGVCYRKDVIACVDVVSFYLFLFPVRRDGWI
jgi:hypothetical protein